MGTKSINDLVVRFQEGCSKAFSAVYDELSPHLFLYAYKLTRDKELAEEIVQDAFVALFHKRDQLDLDKGLGSIKAYMLVSIRNECFKALEKKVRLNARVKEIRSVLPISQDPDVFRQEIVAIIYGKMKKEIEKLPRTQQQVFDLVFLQEKTKEETSIELNINKRTVENAIYRILSVLRMSEVTLSAFITSMLYLNSMHSTFLPIT